MKYIYWAGDSTVKTNKIDTYPQHGIGQMLAFYLKPDVDIINHADNGRSSKSFITEGRLENIKNEIVEGGFLFIQFGHNDSKVDEHRHTEAYGDYTYYLKEYINVALKAKAYPILITSMERRNFDKDGNFVPTHGDYPDAMRKLANEMNIPLIDLCKKTTNLYKKFGEKKTKKWFMHINAGESSIYPEGLNDNTHLNPEGALIMAGLVAEGLKELGGIYGELVGDYNYRQLIS